MKDGILLITAMLQFIKVNPDYRALRTIRKFYKRLKREYKKDGFTHEELVELKEIKKIIKQRTLELK